jgi:Xaa-Pro dipeptidase
MRYLEHQLLQAAAIGASFAPGNEITASLRILKTEVEVQAMRQATSIAETALKAAIPLIKMGMTERELASELVLQLLQAGSLPEFPFDPIVASGPNSAIPHAVPSSRKLQPGDLLIIDWGARVNGYTSDLTRTFSLAEIEPEFRQVHAIVHSANAAGKAGVKPGASCESVDQAARDVIDRAGYGEYFLHRTGHGLGLEAHEPPYITDGNTEVLAPGMTFTIEPGIYLPGRGGVRIEDDVLVTAEGVECLSAYPRELEVIL